MPRFVAPFRIVIMMATSFAGLQNGGSHAADPSPPASGQALGSQVAEERVIVAISVNGQLIDDSVLAIRRADGFYVPREAVTEARLLIGPNVRIIEGPGAPYVALASVPGIRVVFDSGMQELKITADASAFEGQVIELAPRREIAIQPSHFGAFLNYDMLYQRSNVSDSYAAGLFDLGGPVYGGTLQTTGLARSGGTVTEFIRLETSYTQDFPSDMTRLKFGDAISRGGDWGRPARFGGIQAATNFAVQPGYVPFPTANFAGQAALPSTVDIFVNDALRYRGRVDQGPFELNQLPVLTGGGDARVVVTDPLGRQQVVTLPFYVSPVMLREGVADFSYEAGFIRTGYATNDNRYDDAIASATHRYGLTDTNTIEGHTEVMKNRQAAGASLTSTIYPFGEFSQVGAVAEVPSGTGWLGGLGFSRSNQEWSFGIRQRWQSDNFDEGGVIFSLTGSPLRSETLANASYSFGRYGSLSASIAQQDYDNAVSATIKTVNWTMPVGDRAFLTAYVLQAEQEETVRTIGMTLTVMFGRSTTATMDAYSRDGVRNGTLQVREYPLTETGWAYGAAASRGELERTSADLTRRTSVGDFGAAVERYATQSNARLSASGGIAMVDTKVYASRRIDDSFGVVSVPGYPDITVMQENRPIGKTDKDGDLFLPKLQSYYENKIGLDTTDLPIDTDVENLETTVTPGYRGIVSVGFAASQTKARLLVVRYPDGGVIDTGMEIIRRNDGRLYRSGFDGEVFVDAAPNDQFILNDGRRSCIFHMPADADARPRQTVTCEPVQ